MNLHSKSTQFAFQTSATRASASPAFSNRVATSSEEPDTIPCICVLLYPAQASLQTPIQGSRGHSKVPWLLRVKPTTWTNFLTLLDHRLTPETPPGLSLFCVTAPHTPPSTQLSHPVACRVKYEKSTHAHMHTCTHAQMHTHSHTQVRQAGMHAHIHSPSHICALIRMHKCAHTHTHTHKSHPVHMQEQ